MAATFIDEMMKRFRGYEPPQAKKPDPLPALGSPDRERLYRSVQDRSYYLWKEAGEPEGRADEFWRRSLDEHLAQRAEEIWEREGPSRRPGK